MPLRGQTHTSGINARRLLQQMADIYSHAIEETVLVEAVANALDANAKNIWIESDPKAHALIITDDGGGMSEQDFADYHDLAESTKTRGSGIGFAGLGAKVAHQLARKVKTDTRRGSTSLGSDWSWRGDSLVWKQRRGTMKKTGTRVEVQLQKHESPLLDAKWLEGCLTTHYGPLLEPMMRQQYIFQGVYPSGIEFHVGGVRLEPRAMLGGAAIESSAYRDIYAPRGKKVIGRAFFALAKRPLPERMRGVALATMGKVIRYDSMGMNPRSADRLTGWAEVPGLVEYLTTNKLDFIDHGAPGARYRQLRTQVQKQYAAWLAELGENIDAAEAKRAPKALERELADIAKVLPELNYLFGHRERTQVPAPSPAGVGTAEEVQGTLLTEGTTDVPVTNPGGDFPPGPGPDEGFHLEEVANGDVPTTARSRTSRRGPRVQLVHEPTRNQMSWLDADSVFVNTAHSSYIRAYREGNSKYHQRVAALVALCRGSAGDDQLELLERAMGAWGRR